MNREYIKEIFDKKAFATSRPLNLEFSENHTTKYKLMIYTN